MLTFNRSCTVLLLVLCAGLAGSAATGRAYALEGCTVAGAEVSLDPVEAAMFSAINDYRASLGLPRLEPSSALRREALWKAAARANGAAETHDDPDRGWSERFTDCGYRDDVAMGQNPGTGRRCTADTPCATFWQRGRTGGSCVPDSRPLRLHSTPTKVAGTR